MLIVSLSSIPDRFDKIEPTLTSLLRQSAKIDRIIVYIPETYRRFPDYDGRLPVVPEGVEVRRVKHDYGPATKVLCAAQEFSDTDCDILFCDDDRIYAKNWAKTFVKARKEHPDACIAPCAWEACDWFESRQIRQHHPRAVRRWRITDIEFQAKHLIWQLRCRLFGPCEGPSRRVVRRAGYRDIFQGYAGVMLRPGFFDATTFEIPDIFWAVDDFWLSGMLAKNGIPIWTPANCLGPALSEAHDSAPLYKAVIDGADRKTADRLCYEYLRRTCDIWP